MFPGVVIYHLESLPDVKPQIYADNLKCSAARPRALFLSLLISLLSMSGRLVRMFPLVSVFFSALPGAVRWAMKLWGIRVMVVFGRFS